MATSLKYPLSGLADCSPVMAFVSLLSKTKKFESLLADFINSSEQVLGCTPIKNCATVEICLKRQ